MKLGSAPLGAVGAIIAIAATWFVAFFVLVGLGRPLLRMAGVRCHGRDALFVAFWTGFSALIAWLQLWHFFSPITGWTTGLTALAGIAGLIATRSRRPLRGFATLFSRRSHWLLFVALVLWLAHRAAGPTTHYDTLMYHYNGVRWAGAYPIIRGLANVQTALALNTSSFLYDAWLDVGPWDQRAQHTANGLLLAVACGRGVVALDRVARVRRRIDDVFHLVLLGPTLWWAAGPTISSYSSDLVVGALAYFVTGDLIRLVTSPRNGTAGPTTIVLSAAGVCVKLSAGALAVVAIPIALVALYRRNRRRTALVAALAVFILVVPWLVRGAMLSGHPLYPTSIAALEVDWRVSEKRRAKQLVWIRDSARGLSKHDPNPDVWFGRWLKRALVAGTPNTLLPLALVLVAFVMRRRLVSWVPLLPVVFGLVVWAYGAPDLRHGRGLIWCLAAGAVAMASVDRSARFVRNFTCIVIALVFAHVIAWGVVSDVRRGRVVGLRSVLKGVVLPPEEANLSLPAPTECREAVSRFGVVAFVPAEGDFSWRCPLPASHRGNRRLRLLDPQDMGGGFEHVRGWRR